MAENFDVTTTDIDGLLIFTMDQKQDERGWFMEKYRHEALVKLGLPEDFVALQNNVSYNKDIGVTRGIHAEPWDKYISVISGEVFAAYIDLRPGKGFGKVVTTKITPTTAVYLPRGCGNSFQTTQPDTYYSYLVNDYWTAEKYNKYTFVNLADPTLAIAWPIPLKEAIMSDRDQNHPMLVDVKPMEDV